MVADEPILRTIPRACVAKRLKVRGCSVSFAADEYESPWLIDMDCVARSRECPLVDQSDLRCDCLFWGRRRDDSRLCVGVIEVKSRNPDISKAIEQIKAGAHHVEKLVGERKDIRFRPVLVWKGSLSRKNKGRLRDASISLFGQNEKIWPARGGVRFPLPPVSPGP